MPLHPFQTLGSVVQGPFRTDSPESDNFRAVTGMRCPRVPFRPRAAALGRISPKSHEKRVVPRTYRSASSGADCDNEIRSS